MGRGRAKAKQTKVARELKYSSPATDFEALQRELSGSVGSERSDDERAADDDFDDGYDDYRR
jgi:cell division septum initiation protein DivIVA